MGSALRICLGFFRWFPVLFITAVIAWSYYAYVVNLCFLLDPPISIAEKVIYLILYHPILVMFLWAYWKTIFTEPASTPDEFFLTEEEYARLQEQENESGQRQVLNKIAQDKNLSIHCRTINGGVRYCEKCRSIKPDRAHHCSICGKCILKMDHHCPWVNNCVCYNTYKYFIQFLGYALIYCIYIAATVAKYFVKFWTEPGKGNFHILFLFFASVMFSISVVSLFGYHCFLVTKNRSTLESFRAPVFRLGPEKDGWNLGKHNNFIEVFGEDKKKWFLPLFSSSGDGANYPCRNPAPHSYGTTAPGANTEGVFSTFSTNSEQILLAQQSLAEEGFNYKD